LIFNLKKFFYELTGLDEPVMDWGRGRGEGGGDSHIKKDVGNIEKNP